MNSCIYVGQVNHRRFYPKQHGFSYKLFMMYLDLQELSDVFAQSPLWSWKHPNLAWFRRSDYFGDPDVSLYQSVSDFVKKKTGKRPEGPVRLLTHLRYFGYGFNPVSFYYCFDKRGEKVNTVLAEVKNTPWGEKHLYLIPNDGTDKKGTLFFRQGKSLHVSPFMPMDMEYHWRIPIPGEYLRIQLENHRKGRKCFIAGMRMQREAISRASLNRILIRFPLMSIKVIGSIYLQAFKLWMKQIPVYDHPRKQKTPQRANHL